MDVHGGKTICEGPSNYLGNAYRAMPVAITVEGANILTRNLMIFGQGAIRCHPYLLEEIYAAEAADEDEGLARFDRVIYRHVGHALASFARALGAGLTGGRLAHRPKGVSTPALYRSLSRYSAGLAFVTEVVLVHLGGALKRREMISARLGDVLSELYLLSCVLKRYYDDGEPQADLPLVEWCCRTGFANIEHSFTRVFDNYPSRILAALMRRVVLPFGRGERGPSDELARRCAELVSMPGEVRERLTAGVDLGCGDDGISRVEKAFDLVMRAAPVRSRMAEAGFADAALAREKGAIDQSDLELLEAASAAVASAIAVDHFDPAVLSPSSSETEVSDAYRLKVSGTL
jgi:acyl-CoA dehydrogenase